MIIKIIIKKYITDFSSEILENKFSISLPHLVRLLGVEPRTSWSNQALYPVELQAQLIILLIYIIFNEILLFKNYCIYG